MKINYNNGSLRILQLTDIHYFDGRETDIKTINLIDKMIRLENPDLIFITGDIMTNIYDPDRVRLISDAMQVVTKTGIPWCFVFGNHDREGIRDAGELYRKMCKLPGCINPADPEGVPGLGNYTLEVTDRSGKTEWVLFGIDSQMYSINPVIPGYGYIFHDQITWFRNTMDEYSKTLKDGYSVLTFMHIPLPEYNDAWDYAHCGDPAVMDALIACKGEKNEGVCCPIVNTGMFASMIEKGHVKGVFAGHDHINDYDASLYGIRLVYGRACGYSDYGAEGFLHGARLIELHEGNTETFDTHVRLSDGNTVQ